MPDSQPTVLETNVPLSQSAIWRLQRESYGQRGIKAWTEDLVPNFITSNPFIAEIYAKVIFSFLRDSGVNPLRILELGAGIGKFSYLFLRHLSALLRAKGLAGDTVRYCMTDCADTLIESWRSNGYLKEFVESGILGFERLQVGERMPSIFLSGKGPLVVIANYVFDSLPQDAFAIKDGKIHEMLLTTTSPETGPPSISGLQFSYKDIEVPPNRYPDRSWNGILEQYRNSMSAATFTFPTATLDFLKNIAESTDDPMLVLAADKGFAHQEELSLCQGPPPLEFHAGNCFSQMVNFDAIAKYFQGISGEALMPEKHSSGLNICAFLKGRSGDDFSTTRIAYQETQAGFGPDDLFTLLAWLNAHMEEMTVAQILSALRLTRWDPIALLRFYPILARQLRTVSIERNDLHDAIMRTWANHYPVKASENEIAFDCGVVLLELGFLDEALAMFTSSQKILGPSAATSYNLGLCYQGLGRRSEAWTCMVEACKLDPEFKPALEARAKLETQEELITHSAPSR